MSVPPLLLAYTRTPVSDTVKLARRSEYPATSVAIGIASAMKRRFSQSNDCARRRPSRPYSRYPVEYSAFESFSRTLSTSSES